MVQGIDLFFSLFNNIAIFIALISLYSYLYNVLKKMKWYLRQLIMGICFGLFAVGCMYAKIPVFTGVIVDQRNAIIALSGAFGGPVSGFVSAAMAGLYRAYLGGDGVLAGVIGVNLAATAGLILYLWKKSFSRFHTAFYRSIIAVIIILPGFLFVNDFKTGLNLMLSMSLPYGTAILSGILFGGLLLNREEYRTIIERSLRESEEKYRILFDTFPLGITITNETGKIIETNSIAETLVNIPKTEHNQMAVGDDNLVLLTPDRKVMKRSDNPGIISLKENKKVENYIVGVPLPDEKIRWLNVTAAPIPLENYGVAIIYGDITEKKEFETNLQITLKERTILLQELYHRTKNNMQMIISMIETQSDYLTDPELKVSLFEVQSRIHAMALVHEKLYQSKNLSEVNLKHYIKDLVSWLVYSYRIDREMVHIHYELEDIALLIDTAIPCGLIIQEIISNSFKHAFRTKKHGNLTIEMGHTPEKEIRICISDDGPGFPDSFDINKSGKMGILLIKSLGESQLKGSIEFKSKNGVEFSLVFKDDLYSKRI